MARLGRVLVEAIVVHYGRDELLRRLAHPFWFQSLGALMGMDWHSSGVTTSVMGALKRGLRDVEWELGLHVCGGRGRHSRRTPDELRDLGERLGFDGDHYARLSRLVAKVDSAAVQDGYDLYLHSFVIADDGHWLVIQQGMRPDQHQARRYHWLSECLRSFVEEPHQAIDGLPQGEIVNLTDARAAAARRAELELLAQGPDLVVDTLRRIPQPHLTMPAHHEVTRNDVQLRRLHATIAAAAQAAPRDFAELLLTPGLGARTVLALAQVGEIIHGAPFRFRDPARFSLAHGGKDGHPYPVPLKIYDETLRVLRAAVDSAQLGQRDKLEAIRRLDAQARSLERSAIGPDLATFIEREWQAAPALGGRTVWATKRGPAPSSVPSLNVNVAPARQLELSLGDLTPPSVATSRRRTG